MKILVNALVVSTLLSGVAFALNSKTTTTKASQLNTSSLQTKNGFFIGVEGMLGKTKSTLQAIDRDSTDNTEIDNISLHASRKTFDLGLMGGYQHYFGQSQRNGIKVSAHLYSGFGNSWDFSDTRLVGKSSGVGNVLVNDILTISYIPIKFGIDVKYLFDFLQIGKHSLGLNIGVGYQLDSYINGKVTGQAISADPEYNGKSSIKLNKVIFLNNFYPIVGLHYYYGHHQIELMYRFGGIIDGVVKKRIYADEDDDIQSNVYLTFHNQSYLALNYAYRF